jgi:hypothetical protein
MRCLQRGPVAQRLEQGTHKGFLRFSGTIEFTIRYPISHFYSSVCLMCPRCTNLHEKAPKTVHLSQKTATMMWVRFRATWPELLIEKVRIRPFAHWPAAGSKRHKRSALWLRDRVAHSSWVAILMAVVLTHWVDPAPRIGATTTNFRNRLHLAFRLNPRMATPSLRALLQINVPWRLPKIRADAVCNVIEPSHQLGDSVLYHA